MWSLARKLEDAWNRRTFLAKIFSFAAVGLVNAVVDVSVFTFLIEVLHFQLVPANILSWMVAVSGSYIMNTKITFGRESKGLLKLRGYLRFAASGVLGVTIGTTVLVVLSNYTSVLLAKIASALAGFLVNFSMSHFFVFRTQSVGRTRD